MPKYDNLINLINKAKGNRSLNRFADDCGIDAGHLSRVLRGKMVNSPSPDTLRKIADNAHNLVTYESLMTAAGHLERRFIGDNLALLRGTRTYNEYSEYLKKDFNVEISAILLERYEKEIEKPDEIIIDYISFTENVSTDFFYSDNKEMSMETMQIKDSSSESKYKALNKNVLKWSRNPDNYPYIEFIYNAYKAGITKDLLDKAEITIKLK